MPTTEQFVKTYTIVGRIKEDAAKFQDKGVGYIGKHIVGTGEDAHITTKVLLDLLRPHIILISGKRGTGKCLEENSLLTLDDGSLVPIKDLEGLDKKILGLNNQLKISQFSVDKFYKRQVDKLLHIKLRSGKEIKLTHEHPLLTISGWKDARELFVGSRIATPRKIETFGDLLMKESEIKLLAYLIAEGHLSNQFVLFSNFDSDILNEFYKSVIDFDKDLKLSVHSKFGCYRISKMERKSEQVKVVRDKKGRFSKGNITRLKKSSLMLWLEKIGLYGKLSKEKFIPSQIFNLPEHQISIFLNRLFSCDGSIYKRKRRDRKLWQISYSSSSEVLIKQVHHLLLRFEILSKIRKRTVHFKGKDFVSYELLVQGENIVKFITRIGFYGRKQLKQKMALEDVLNVIRNSNVDTIPKEVWQLYKIKNWEDVGIRLDYSNPDSARYSMNYSPTRTKLVKIAEVEQNAELYTLASSDIFWDEIIDIEELTGNFTVYDIEVPDSHNFVANDIIVHNSYVAGVIAEEIAMLPEEYRNNISVVIIDTMGIFWSMKRPNDQQSELLKDWNLEPKAFTNIKVLVPFKQLEEYKASGLPVDAGISVLPWEFAGDEWALAFNLERTDPASIALEKNVNSLIESKQQFLIPDLISKIRDDRETAPEVKDSLENMLTVANQWGVFGTEGVNIDDLVQPGQISVVDLSRLRSSGAWSVRNFLVALIARKIYQFRVVARKEEELAKMEGTSMKKKYPIVWLIADECHNWVPADHVTVSSAPFLTIAKEGREPGVSLICITQMPSKIHQDILSQTDLVITHRLTSKDDLDALHSVVQTYMQETIEKFINSLPRWPGAALILDDNLEKIFSVNVRPRLSWHAGGTAIVV